ncbi:MAG: tRNA (adenosine(37)-N6)-dimethylallyltransferase MiaA, partial [Paramuribaculum sp.]|nr:tRNA (adenosine(37)-N6)-dimethylallyltransferase MiaA [Paramuribaculum sp.]
VITGPTGSGKTDLAICLARRLGCHILSADSRQIYRGLRIGTAAPDESQLAAAPHHFIGSLDLTDYYSAANYETDALALLDRLFKNGNHAIMCGGSMMYIDAVTRGIDDLPTISDNIRRQAMKIFTDGGIEAVRQTLRELDPAYYETVDRMNHKRMIHAIEISLQAGTPYSALRTGQTKQRPFRILKFAIDIPREQLFDRINRRVDAMIEAGLEKEARDVFHLRHLNSLNTVGYKELFAMFDGSMDRATAIARIAKNTRVYAKKQLTWLRRDPSVIWIKPETAIDNMIAALEEK